MKVPPAIPATETGSRFEEIIHPTPCVNTLYLHVAEHVKIRGIRVPVISRNGMLYRRRGNTAYDEFWRGYDGFKPTSAPGSGAREYFKLGRKFARSRPPFEYFPES